MDRTQASKKGKEALMQSIEVEEDAGDQAVPIGDDELDDMEQNVDINKTTGRRAARAREDEMGQYVDIDKIVRKRAAPIGGEEMVRGIGMKSIRDRASRVRNGHTERRLEPAPSRASSPNPLPLPESRSSPVEPELVTFTPGGDVEEFFRMELPDSERMELLLYMFKGFPWPRDLPLMLDKSRWSGYFEINPDPESSPDLVSFDQEVSRRLHRLKQVREKIVDDEQVRDKIPDGNGQARRIWSLCMAHEVEFLSQHEIMSKRICPLKTPYLLAKDIAARCITTLEDDKDRFEPILHILRIAGPGALLIDCRLSRERFWEVKLRPEEIDVVYKCKRVLRSDIVRQTERRDPEALQAILEAFMAVGWPRHDLLSCTTDVAKLLRWCLEPRESRQRQHGNDEPPGFWLANKIPRSNEVEEAASSFSHGPSRAEASNGVGLGAPSRVGSPVLSISASPPEPLNPSGFSKDPTTALTMKYAERTISGNSKRPGGSRSTPSGWTSIN